MSKSAKIVYRPIGLIASVTAGALAAALFKQVWRRIAHEDDAPDALQSEYSLGKVILAATLQGAIFAAIKALIDRGGARGFQRITGEWPGS